MQYTRLGETGLVVSRLCLGCMTYGSRAWRDWVLEEDEALPFFERALEAGINFFDTADVYSNGVSEEILGRALGDLVADREDVVIATKCYGGTHDRRVNRYGLSRKHILDACERSLQRLGTDYIDLYQIHRFDPSTPIEETLETLHDLVRAGKVRYIGASSMWTWQFAKYLAVAERRGWSRFVSMQNHYNLIYREEEREMIPFCRDQGVGLVPWSPLARGFLAGNRRRDGGGETQRAQSDAFAQRMYYRENDFEVAERNAAVAERLGVKPVQSALAWVLAKPGIAAPIIGASRLEHLDDVIAAMDIELTAEDLAELQEPYRPHPVLGHQ